jgi:formate hydrogenlyase transcriptional activator
MQCDSVSVALPDSESRQLLVYALDFPNGKGVFPEEIRIAIDDDSAAARVYQTGNPVSVVAGDSNWTRLPVEAEGIESLCHIALISRSRTLGLLSLARLAPVPFSPRDLEFLSLVANQVAIAVENALAYREIAELKDRLAREKVYLEDEIRSELSFEEIVGRSPALRSVLQEIETVAPTDSTVLIYGETGTGKELIARAIHNLSLRSKSNFVKLNCAAIPTGLLESEMFGHERGAFTGAVAQRIGRFELAHHGTVFLDEIGEIPLELQPKLLRVLQEREFERLGSSRTLRTDARLIAATNRDLAEMVEDQTFRADLFYRLNVFPVHVPPLRERQEDIPLLVRHFVQQFARRMGRAVDTIPTEAMNVLVHYHWPGNIRELQNLVERAVILSAGPVLKVPLHDLQAQPAAAAARKTETLEESERRHILDALDAADWLISGPRGAATALGLKRSTLQARMEKLGIRRARAAAPSQNSR